MYVTVFNSSATWAATFRLRGYTYVHAGYFRVSIIHRTLTWTLTCVHGLSIVCVHIHTQGLGPTPTASQHIFDSEKLYVFLVLPTGFEPSTFGSPVQESTDGQRRCRWGLVCVG